jgi:hypothetical protein
MSVYHSLVRKYDLEMEIDSLLGQLKSKNITKEAYLKEVDRIIDEKQAQILNHSQKINYKPQKIYNWENQSGHLMANWFESLLGCITSLVEDDLYLKWKELVDSDIKLGGINMSSDENVCHDHNCNNPLHNHKTIHKSIIHKSINNSLSSDGSVTNKKLSIKKLTQNQKDNQDYTDKTSFEKRFLGQNGEQIRQIENYFWHDLEHKFTNDLYISNRSNLNLEIVTFCGLLMSLGLSPAKSVLIHDCPAKIVNQKDANQIKTGKKSSVKNVKNLDLNNFLDFFGKEGLRFFYLFDHSKKHSNEILTGEFEFQEIVDSYNQVLVKNISNLVTKVSDLAESHLSGIVDWNREYEVFSNENLQEIEDLKLGQKKAMEQADSDQEYQDLYTEMVLKRGDSLDLETDLETDLRENLKEGFDLSLKSDLKAGLNLTSQGQQKNSTEIRLTLDLNSVYGYLFNLQPHLAFQALIDEFIKIQNYLNQTKPEIIAEIYQNKENSLENNNSQNLYLKNIFDQNFSLKNHFQEGQNNKNQGFQNQNLLNQDLQGQDLQDRNLTIWSEDELEAREKVDYIISSAASGIKVLNEALAIFLPETAFKIHTVLDSEFVKKSPVLFKKFD